MWLCQEHNGFVPEIVQEFSADVASLHQSGSISHSCMSVFEDVQEDSVFIKFLSVVC